MSTVDIGAARVHLIVDAAEYDQQLARALNAAHAFGADAARAFDASSAGTKRASRALLDYVSDLGRVSNEQTRFMTLMRRAAAQGADASILKAATEQFNEYAVNAEIAAMATRSWADQQKLASAAAKELQASLKSEEDAVRRTAEGYAQLRVEALQAERARQGQLDINALLGVDREPATQSGATMEALVRQAQQFEAELTAAYAQARKIDEAFDQARASLAQMEVNNLLGVDANSALQMGASMDALVEQARQFEAELSAAHSEALRIDDAFNQARASLAQLNFNSVLGVDKMPATQMGASIEALTQEFQQMDRIIDEALSMDAQRTQFLTYLKNLEQSAGKTHYEMLQLRNAQMGGGEAGAKLIRAIQGQNEAMGAGTLSAKQYEWAMRGLPAQITDIVVSLASGQPAYMVALQQGGQLKDMFGGIGSAAQALGSAVMKMINPITVGAATLGAMAFAAYQAEQRYNEFVIAAARTGDLSGGGESLREFADQLARIDDISRGNASAAVLELSANGALVGENMRIAAQASARWATATGESVDEVASRFEGLAKSPLEALSKLNEAEHFLTEAQYTRIKALIDEGDEQRAVAEAVALYADVVNNRSSDIEQNLGAMTTWWREIKEVVSDAWAEVQTYADLIARVVQIQGTFSNDGVVGKLANTYRNALPGMGIINLVPDGAMGDANERVKRWLQDIGGADFSGVTGSATHGSTLTREQTTAMAELERQMDRSGTKAQQLDAAMRNLHKTLADVPDATLAAQGISRSGDGYTGSGYDQLVADLRERYKESAGKKPPSGRDGTQAIRDQLAVELAMMRTQTMLLEGEYERREVSVSDYYNRLIGFAERERDLTIAANNEQIASLAGKRDEERQVNTLRAANQRAEETFTQRKIELDKAAADALLRQRMEQEAYSYALAQGTEALRRDMEAQAARVGMGAREYEMQQRIVGLYVEQSEALHELQRQLDAGDISDEQYELRRQERLDTTRERLNTVIEGYEEIRRAEGDWVNGASRALADYLATASDVAGQTYDLFSGAFSGMEDAWVQFTTTGKVSFTDMANSIVKDLSRIAYQKAFMMMFGGGMAADGNTRGTLADLFSGSGFGFAKGGVPGGDGLSAYRGQLVSKPTFFPFAKGGVPNVGVMGEAGTEGIFPLKRGRDGKLGVSAEGSAPNVIVNVHNAPAGTDVRTSTTPDGDLQIDIDMLVDTLDSQLGGRVADGRGAIYAALKARTNIQEQV